MRARSFQRVAGREATPAELLAVHTPELLAALDEATHEAAAAAEALHGGEGDGGGAVDMDEGDLAMALGARRRWGREAFRWWWSNGGSAGAGVGLGGAAPGLADLVFEQG